jgi:hypothetical protein
MPVIAAGGCRTQNAKKRRAQRIPHFALFGPLRFSFVVFLPNQNFWGENAGRGCADPNSHEFGYDFAAHAVHQLGIRCQMLVRQRMEADSESKPATKASV